MRTELVEGEDFYYEGPYLVFTEKFLRDRGYCCESGCRHCPYGFKRPEPEAGEQGREGADIMNANVGRDDRKTL